MWDSERLLDFLLRARDDYEVLRLSPGCTLTALKKRYREMAVVLHPDKSMVSGHTRLSMITLQAVCSQKLRMGCNMGYFPGGPVCISGNSFRPWQSKSSCTPQ